MFFQISPGVQKRAKPTTQKKDNNEESRVETLSLAPFTSSPKLEFNNVLVGTDATRKLIVKNPTGSDFNLYMKAHIPDDMDLVLSWNECTLLRGTERLLEITWRPTKEEVCRHKLMLCDGQQMNRNIFVVFRSVQIKQATGCGTAKKNYSKPISSNLKLVKKKISPTKKFYPHRKSPIRPPPVVRTLNSEKENISPLPSKQQLQYTAPTDSKVIRSLKENLSTFPQQLSSLTTEAFVIQSDVTFNIQDEIDNLRRDTFTVRGPLTSNRNTLGIEMKNLEDTFGIHQNISPIQQNLAETRQIFAIRHCNEFFDSLESPLLQNEKTTVHTPSLELLLRGANAVNYEARLNKNTLAVSPMRASITSSPFMPLVCSSTSKPPSTNNSHENSSNVRASIFEQSLSENSYIKDNVSSETYVANNSSCETYTKINLSGGTYVKDESDGLVDVSPCSSATHLTTSSNLKCPRRLELSTSNEGTSFGLNLSAIPEESSLYHVNMRNLRTGSKRKSSLVGSQPKKRERTQTSNFSAEAFRVSKSTSGLNLKKFANFSCDGNNRSISCLSETTTKTFIVKNPFLYANIIDPFMSSSIYSDEDWVEQQEKNFEKWLNTLLTPPDELDVKNEIDVAKIWQECTTKDVSAAPSKEHISIAYHTNKKLEHLRKQAQNLFRSKEICDVLQKVCNAVDSGKLSIRNDKDIHLNLNLKSGIIRLVLSYNPLWLRIGLETIYNEVIPLRSNSDSQGLANFILERFFKDPHLLKKWKTMFAPKYTSELKKLILKKFLILVYFLDRSKTEKLIQHDPCLFCRNAVEKESKQMLIHFARETLSGIGDITKYLRCLGYVVTHSQSYIHEFEYGIQNLGVDLRDGVRLARVMEIIQMRNDLTARLRVPAISRLQKMHNVQLVFTSLQESGFEIMYDIVAKDIVDGHRNKTLSFLWQIIYKFEAPLMVKSATTIQTWFRSLPVQLKRLKFRIMHQNRENAAKKIQSWYRCQKVSELYYALGIFVKNYVQERKRLAATIKLQSFVRMVICRRNYQRVQYIILKLQANSKGWLIRHSYRQRIYAAIIIQKSARSFICRRKFLQLKQAALTLQAAYRARKSMMTAKQAFVNLKTAAVIIQRKFRAKCLMRICYSEYVMLRNATIQIQAFYRMQSARKQFVQLKSAAIVVQRKYKAIIAMRNEKQKYMSLKRAVLCVQTRFRAQQDMKRARNRFILLKVASIRIQSYYRMVVARNRYVKLQKAACAIQQRYRAYIAMTTEKKHYTALRNAVMVVQRRFRANRLRKVAQLQYLSFRRSAIIIQSYYKMYNIRKCYIEFKGVVVWIQRKFVAKKLMKKNRQTYTALKRAAITIQQRWRANRKGRQENLYYTRLKKAVVVVQQRYRANKLMLQDQQRFIEIRSATCKVQTWYRSILCMRVCQQRYCLLKKNVLIIEQRFMALNLMRIARTRYIHLQKSAVIIQRNYKALLEMRACRAFFLELRCQAIVLQRRYRANKSMKMCSIEYQKLRKAVTSTQTRFRANKKGRLQRDNFILQKTSAIRIQRWYRSVLEMRKCQNYFTALKRAIRVIENRFDAKKQMQIYSKTYQSLRKATISIQRYYRNIMITRLCQKEFLQKRKATITIQRWFRSYQYTKVLSRRFQQLRAATLFVQRTYKAKRKMVQCKTAFINLKKVTVFIQARYRAKIMMQLQRAKFIRFREATLQIQRRYKANILMRQGRTEYMALRQMAVLIQQKYRATVTMRNHKLHFETLKKYTILIQRRYRAHKIAKICQTEYVTLRKATITIQTRFRAMRLSISCFTQYSKIKWAVLVVQRRFRAQKAMKVQAAEFLKLKKATCIIQRRFRANALTKIQRKWFLKVKESAKIIQMHFISYLKMKRQRELYLKLRSGSLCFQKFARGYLARKKYAPSLTKEAIQIRKILKMQNRAAITIQATWRGYSLRKSNIPQLIALKRVQQRILSEPKKICESRTLAQRCEAAMICMTTENSSLLMIMNALEDLEFIARHCREVCMRLSFILPNQLYIIIMAAARSLPEMNTLNVATLILITFCKYSQTRANSFNPDCINDIINVMLHWCDKEAPLFCTLCTLLWLFAQEDQWKEIILGLPNINQRLSKIRALINRKQNMVLHSKKNNLHSVFTISRDAAILPTRTANWGLDYDRPVTFKTAPFAFNCLLKALGLC